MKIKCVPWLSTTCRSCGITILIRHPVFSTLVQGPLSLGESGTLVDSAVLGMDSK